MIHIREEVAGFLDVMQTSQKEQFKLERQLHGLWWSHLANHLSLCKTCE